MFVNWKFLEENINKIKKEALSEVMNPADRALLTQQDSANPQADDQQNATPARDSQMQNAPNMSADNEDSDEEVEYIEVQNVKGKIKKIDPNDYEVMILGENDRQLFVGRLGKMASGMYTNLLNAYGTKKTIECIVKDFINNKQIFNEPQLDFVQAKLIVSSFITSLGSLPKKSLIEIQNKLGKKSKEEFDNWLETRKPTIT